MKPEITHMERDVKNIVVTDTEQVDAYVSGAKKRAILSILHHDGPFTVFLGNPIEDGIMVDSNGIILTTDPQGQIEWFQAIGYAVQGMIDAEMGDTPTGDLGNLSI